MKRLIELNAPDVILAYEAENILRAYHKADGDWKLLAKLFIRFYVRTYYGVKMDAEILWYRFKGMTEDDAVEYACGGKYGDPEEE